VGRAIFRIACGPRKNRLVSHPRGAANLRPSRDPESVLTVALRRRPERSQAAEGQGTVDLIASTNHSPIMHFDISVLLNEWEYRPGHIGVRQFKGKDGKMKIQLRVDLGVLQMNAEGRPDGKKPFGHESLLEHYETKLVRYRKAHG